MFKLIKKIFKLVLVLLVIYLAVITTLGYHQYGVLTEEKPIEQLVEQVRAKEGYVTLEEMSGYLPDAIVAIEDKRFYQHGAIDYIGLARAITVNIVSRKALQGGSTLTQQLAKNLYHLSDAKVSRKVSEAFIANKLEKIYSKEEILELYLNVAYFGDGNTGVYEASLNYFDCYPQNLSLAQASMLAGMVQAPSYYALSNRRPESYDRRRQVLKAMLDQKMITQLQYKEADDEIVY